jgi:hypothetical protein
MLATLPFSGEGQVHQGGHKRAESAQDLVNLVRLAEGEVPELTLLNWPASSVAGG